MRRPKLVEIGVGNCVVCYGELARSKFNTRERYNNIIRLDTGEVLSDHVHVFLNEAPWNEVMYYGDIFVFYGRVVNYGGAWAGQGFTVIRSSVIRKVYYVGSQYYLVSGIGYYSGSNENVLSDKYKIIARNYYRHNGTIVVRFRDSQLILFSDLNLALQRAEMLLGRRF